jgi:hypothetical protein
MSVVPMSVSIISIVLSVLAPLLFVYTFKRGISESSLPDERKIKFKKRLNIIIVLWVILVWVLSLTHVLSYHKGDLFPRFTVALAIPVLAGLLLFFSQDFKEVLSKTPLYLLVGSQGFRLLGVVFFTVAAIEGVPSAVGSAGYGDLLTGSLALIAGYLLYNKKTFAILTAALFNIVGLLDLLSISRTLLVYYPLYTTSASTTAPLTTFPVVLILAIVAPIALLLHIYSIKNMLAQRKQESGQ